MVSTHSRPKAAGIRPDAQPLKFNPFQHTAARRRLGHFCIYCFFIFNVSTHSRPKAAGRLSSKLEEVTNCFNTQPPEGGWHICWIFRFVCKTFQHTATRRRLGIGIYKVGTNYEFQHTAARRRLVLAFEAFSVGGPSFNTQPPEGGWIWRKFVSFSWTSFNTQPPEGGWFCNK